jgi:hypothetical protein
MFAFAPFAVVPSAVEPVVVPAPAPPVVFTSLLESSGAAGGYLTPTEFVPEARIFKLNVYRHVAFGVVPIGGSAVGELVTQVDDDLLLVDDDHWLIMQAMRRRGKGRRPGRDAGAFALTGWSVLPVTFGEQR